MKKIAIVTGSRAEYGLLRPLAQKIKNSGEHQLLMIATGMHLSLEYGDIEKEIKEDGLEIEDKVEMLLSSDSDCAVTKSMGLGIIGFADLFRKKRPHLVIVLGDRFEIFAAVQAAYFAKIPVAHIHGGELTEGAIDDGIRHSITKLSHYHFTSTEAYRSRVIQLGEQPERTFNVGALGIDNLKTISLLSRENLVAAVGNLFNRDFLVVTYHPVTLENHTAEEQCQNLLDALDRFPNYAVLFTKANADMGGRVINTMIEAYAAQQPERVAVFSSLGTKRYLSAVAHASAVIGNSSSGIIEVPSLGVPTVNIGDRQLGRIMGPSIINCKATQKDIVTAIEKSLTEEHRLLSRNNPNPYGDGHTADLIYETLDQLLSFEIKMKKEFYNLRGEFSERDKS